MKEYLRKLIQRDIDRISNEINQMENRYRSNPASNQSGLDEAITKKGREITKSRQYLKNLEKLDFNNL